MQGVPPKTERAMKPKSQSIDSQVSIWKRRYICNNPVNPPSLVRGTPSRAPANTSQLRGYISQTLADIQLSYSVSFTFVFLLKDVIHCTFYHPVTVRCILLLSCLQLTRTCTVWPHWWTPIFPCIAFLQLSHRVRGLMPVSRNPSEAVHNDARIVLCELRAKAWPRVFNLSNKQWADDQFKAIRGNWIGAQPRRPRQIGDRYPPRPFQLTPASIPAKGVLEDTGKLFPGP